MPELPEVHTTVEGLKKLVINKMIRDVWSDFHVGTAVGARQTIKNRKYFDKFRKIVMGAKIKSLERRGKNILIHLSNKHTIVVHMKMTGHLMVGKYKFKNKKWVAIEKGPLQDSFNRFIHLVFSLSNKKHLVLSDMRKFAKVCFFETSKQSEENSLSVLGPDPIKLSYKKFKE